MTLLIQNVHIVDPAQRLDGKGSLLVVDGREGASALDDDILRWLRKLSKPTLLIVNKTDGLDARAAIAEFARYGINEALPISSAHRDLRKRRRLPRTPLRC